MSRTSVRLKRSAVRFMMAAALTYLSLLVPGHVTAVCGNLGTPIYCPVLAYGFPLPFLADSRSTSPVGSVARDPLSILAGVDDLLLPQVGLAFLFWMLVKAIGVSGWRRWIRRRNATENRVSTSHEGETRR
jgi:hypothetical protein